MTNPEQERSAEELMRELDRDSMTRLLTGRRKRVVDFAFIAYAVIMMVMTLVVSGATPYTRQPLFLGLTLCIGYLKYPATKKLGNRKNYLPWYDIALAVLSLLTYGDYVGNQNNIILMAQRIGLTEIIISSPKRKLGYASPIMVYTAPSPDTRWRMMPSNSAR